MLSQYKPKAVIFDFDGTLADSMWVWDAVDKEFARKRNLPFDKEHAETIAALGFEGTAAWLLEQFGLNESVENLIEEWLEIALPCYANEVQLKPGARELINDLRASGVKVGIATSLQRMLLEPALKSNGVFELFDAIVVCEEVCEGGKSTPAVYQEAARLMGVDLHDCVVFEDVAKAARSAKAGGAHVIGVRDDHMQQIREDLVAVCDAFVNSFEELLQSVS